MDFMKNKCADIIEFHSHMQKMQKAKIYSMFDFLNSIF